jgi:SAM-dependent methyltransferase
MIPDDQKRIVDFYEDSFLLYGNDPRSVHWSNEHTQDIRFEILSNIGDLKHRKILDVGCGLGDFYKFFLKKEIEVEYTGIDIVPTFVERAKVRFPDAHCVCGNIETLTDEYDYIFASGVFNINVTDAKTYYFRMIENIFRHTRIGFAFNMLNIQSHQSDDTYIAYDKDEVVAFCKTISPQVVVIDTYLPWDFTVYMYTE